MIRIILADDHDIVREGVRRILETYPDFEVVAEAADGDAAMHACSHTQAHVLVLDMDMPGGGFNTLKRITDAQIQIKVLVLTLHDNEEYALRALREGAAGYMLKASPPGTLPQAIRKVAGGVRHVDPSIMEKIAGLALDPPALNPLTPLSTREIQVLARIGRFMTQKQIAEELNLSLSAVSTYKRRIMDKLDIQSNAELQRFIQSQNVLNTDVF